MSKNFVIDNSFQLIRTNPKLTSNVKVVIDKEQHIYLESFNSNKQLSDNKYKHFRVSKDSYFEDKIPVFYNNLPINTAFEVKYDNDVDIVYDNYVEQFDNIYFSGAKKIEDNEFFQEEFEYLAPLYIRKGKLPSNFIILRVDGPGAYEQKLTDYSITDTNKDNFRNEIINKWKCIDVFDMSYQSDFGFWLDKNFVNNERFPTAPLEVDFKRGNYSRFYGIDYTTGVYTDKSVYLDDKLYYEQPHFKLEEFITESYKNNELIFPNIVNFKFLFDDTPATPKSLKKYSINRYLGFYTQSMEMVKRVTPYKQETLKDDKTIKIENNIFKDMNGNNILPFENNIWDDDKQYYIFAKDNLQKVVKIDNGGSYSYKIISNENIKYSDININNENVVEINYTNVNTLKLINSDTKIDQYINTKGLYEMDADLYLIKIDNKYHVLEHNIVDDEDIYTIRTDYGIEANSEELKYWIVNKDIEEYSTTVAVEDDVNKLKPLTFEIYKIKFSDIKDFDFDRVDTHFADFELDIKDEYVVTPEQKLYTTDFLDKDINKKFKEYPIGNKHEEEIVVVSSEYISTDELYEINNNTLGEIWRKNQNINKWGYMGSNSNSDYPYKLNNSKKVGEVYNKTTNPFLSYASVTNKTNEYFYRLGDIKISGVTQHYDTQTVTIENELYKPATDASTVFDLGVYVQSNVDYFDYFFKNNRYKRDGIGIEQTTKYSSFVNGTKYNPSSTLFRGLKYNIRNVSEVVRNRGGGLVNIITNKDVNYNDYKFSVIYNTRTPGSTKIANSNILYGENSIHVFLNEVYKNVLIVIDTNEITEDFSIDDPYEGIYINENSGIHVANNFVKAMNVLNDRNVYTYGVTYHYIDSNGKHGKTGEFFNDDTRPLEINNGINPMSGTTFGKNYPPFIIDIDTPDELLTKRKAYKKAAIKGPKYNIYDKYKKDFFEIPYDKSAVKEPIARKITINENELKPRARVHGESLEYDNKIYRYSGPYEPIFKDIQLFKTSEFDFFDTNIFNIEHGGNNVSQSGSTEDNSSWLFKNKLIGECNNDYCVCDMSVSTSGTNDSSNLVIKNFEFNIPTDSSISRITLSIKRKAYKKLYYTYIQDNTITTSNGLSFDVGDLSDTGATGWNEVDDVVTYTINDPNITTDDINDEDFSIKINVKMTNTLTNQLISNTAYIDCVKLNVYYVMNSIQSGEYYFVNNERNYKFDTTLEDFGMVEEIQFSKVNETENMLKLKKREEDRSIYPMLDEFGLQYGKRFIFKSSWDSDFYIRTKNNIIDKDER